MNIDSNLHMFIATVCEKCTNLDCKGAFDPLSRDKCGLYDTWLKLSPTERSKQFLAHVSNQIEFFEELVK